MEFKRENYLNQLLNARHNAQVKIITGLRRSGKSYLLFNLFKRRLLDEGIADGNIVEVNLDSRKFLELRDPRKLCDYVEDKIRNNGQWHYVFIDEIQQCRRILLPGIKLKDVAKEDRDTVFYNFYDALNELSRLPNVDVYVTGSNSRLLSKDIATSFRGRGREIRLYPLTFLEYCENCDLEKGAALEKYLVWGGMPLAVLEKDDVARSRYLKSLFTSVYLRDIEERHGLKYSNISEALLDMLCSVIGSLTNPARIVRILSSTRHVKTTDRTIKKYLDYFEDAFLFQRADRYDIKGGRRLNFPQKYYATDLGLRNARQNFSQLEKTHLMENLIYNELVARGYDVNVGVISRCNSGQQKGPLEIDFMVDTGLSRVYIQSAFQLEDERKIRQETASLKSCNDSFKKIVVTWGYQQPLPDGNGIIFVGLIPFLTGMEKILG